MNESKEMGLSEFLDNLGNYFLNVWEVISEVWSLLRIQYGDDFGLSSSLITICGLLFGVVIAIYKWFRNKTRKSVDARALVANLEDYLKKGNEKKIDSEVLEMLHSLVENFVESPEFTKREEAERSSAMMELKKGNPEGMANFLKSNAERYREQYKNSESKYIQAKIEYGLFNFYLDPRLSLKCFNEVVSIEPENFPAWSMLEMLYSRLGELQLAGIAVEEMIRLSETLDLGDENRNARMRGIAESSAAIYYKRSENYDLARKYSDKGISTFLPLGDSRSLCRLYSNIASIYFEEHKIRNPSAKPADSYALRLAEQNYRDAGELCKNLKPVYMSSIYSNLANVEQARGSFRKAEILYTSALWIDFDEKNLEGVSYELGHLANIRIYFKDYKTAEKLLRESIDLCGIDKLNRPSGVLNGRFNLGLIYLELEQFISAKVELSAALEIAEAMFMPLFMARSRFNLAMAESALGNEDVATAHLVMCEPVLKEYKAAEWEMCKTCLDRVSS